MKQKYTVVIDQDSHVIYDAEGEIVSFGRNNEFLEGWIRTKREEGDHVTVRGNDRNFQGMDQ